MKLSMITANENNHSDLIEQLRQGSVSAFNQLYDQYHKQLLRNLLRLVADEDIAAELLQDLFLKIWMMRENLDPEKSIKSLLYQIAKNLVYSHFRKVTKDYRLIKHLKANFVEADTYMEETIIESEEKQLLQKAINNLPPKRKQIFELCKIEGKSYEEVSLQLGIASGTVNNQIVKANRMLVSSLQKYDAKGTGLNKCNLIT